MTKKNILICDKNQQSALAIKSMFEYFKYNVTVVTAGKLKSLLENLSYYDILLVDIETLDFGTLELIREAKERDNVKILNLCRAFDVTQGYDDRSETDNLVDDVVVKPTSQERIYELILELFGKENREGTTEALSRLKIMPQEEMIETKNITINNFRDFQGKHLLVVEDNIIDQKVLQSILGKAGVIITIASNGKEALQALEEEKYDLILMDISMPIMDGYQTVEVIRSDKRYDNLPIVSFTSLALDSDINKMFQSGINAYLRKPLVLGRLYTVLNFYFGKDLPPHIEDTKSYPSFDGLDIARGIAHSNNSEGLYSEVLDEFLTSYGNSDKTLEQYVNEHRNEHIKRLCLDMKGLTGAIGAYAMYGVVDMMHKQFLYKNVHLIPKFVEEYSRELTKLVKAIHAYRDEEKA